LPEISSSTFSVTYKLTVPSKRASGQGGIEEVLSEKYFTVEGLTKQGEETESTMDQSTSEGELEKVTSIYKELELERAGILSCNIEPAQVRPT